MSKLKEAYMAMRKSDPKNSAKKLRQVLLYLSGESKLKARLSSSETRVQKIAHLFNKLVWSDLYSLLYLIDFDFYEKYEEQLIGGTYIKTSDPHKGVLNLLNTLVNEEERRPPGSLTKREKAVVKDAFLFLSGTERDWLELVQEDIPWVTADENKIIDYETVFYRAPEFSLRGPHVRGRRRKLYLKKD